MDATMFDGTRTQPMDATSAAGHASRGFAWYDLDVGEGAGDAAAILTALDVDPEEQVLLLKPRRTAVLQAAGERVRAVLWLGEEVDGDAPPEVHLLWTPAALVTVRWGGGGAIDVVRRALAARAEALFHDPPSVLPVVMTLMNETVDRRLTALDLDLNEIDDAIVSGGGESQRHRLRALRGEIAALQLRYAGLYGVTAAAVVDAGSLPGMTDDTARRMRSYATHVSDTYQHVRGLAAGGRAALQDYQTLISDRQGDRINQLTIVSVVFLPISFLTGYFGMNFQWLDNQLLSAASWVVWGVVLPAAVLALSVVALREYGFLRRRHRMRPPDSPTLRP